jgi:hypothetical protein
MEVSGQLHASAATFQGKNLRYLSDRRLGGPQSRSGCSGKEKNSIAPTGNRNPIAPIFQPVVTAIVVVIIITHYFNLLII